MQVRTERRLLWTSGGTLIAGSVIVALLSHRWPPNGALVSNDPLSQRSRRNAPASIAEPLTADALKMVAKKRIRQPLYDPPPVVQVELQKPPPPPLLVRAVGTIVEPGQCRAILVGPDGKTEIKSVGDTVGGAEILEIGSDSVTVVYLKTPVTLRVTREGNAR